MTYKNIEVVPVKDFYRNIPSKGKVKELSKNKVYKCTVEYNYGKKYFFIRTDLGDIKTYCKKNMFVSRVNLRDKKIDKLLNEV